MQAAVSHWKIFAVNGMAYKLLYHKRFEKTLRKLPPQVGTHILESVEILQTEPDKGKPLRGQPLLVRSLRTVYLSVHYRILYYVNHPRKTITLIDAGTREGIYKTLQRLRLR